MSKYNLIWDIESLFAGGSESEALQDTFFEISSEMNSLNQQWQNFPKTLDATTQQQWAKFVLQLQSLRKKVRDSGSFVGCLLAQNVKDEKAYQLKDQYTKIETDLDVFVDQFASLFKEQNADDWQAFINQPEISPLAFRLNEYRDIAQLKMDADKETLVTELAADGYHAWGTMYNRLAGQLEVDFEENGEQKRLSVGQLASKMQHPDRNIRHQAFDKLESAWQSVAPLTAMTLNHLGGFRHTVYQHREWNFILQESLQMNRLSRQTLDTMWSVIAEESVKLKSYFEAKAKLLGIDQLSWYDIQAPVGEPDKTYTYDDACQFILDQHTKFDPNMSDFSKMAMEKNWIEAEDRSGKRAGAFCTSFPSRQQSRVFMTFTGTYGNLSTLAHELGHAYHSWVMRDLPHLVQRYPMTLAETASIFSETIVADGAFNTATTDGEKLFLLDIKLNDAVSLFMNIRARYLFELSFYENRKNRALPVDELNQLMKDAQQQAFHGFLDPNGYHPLFWASKLHFYITYAPFYNYPYTFGFLFSHGIYKRAVDEGAAFAQKYVDLLRDTGRMTCEELAKKHLDIDLTQPDFWVEAVRQTLSDLDSFIALVDSKK